VLEFELIPENAFEKIFFYKSETLPPENAITERAPSPRLEDFLRALSDLRG
jgi:hypothetical protein